jgi:uncharacterized protein YdeI (YjbR/CyaY-like superfamily)
VEAGLCFGWIDGQKKGYDERSWLQRFTPRGPQSIWSKVNRAKAEALIAAGLAAVERSRQTGRRDAAYDPASTATVPEDLQAALDGANRYALLFRIQTAKRPETRPRRIQEFIAMLERGEKLYP